ncbi:MAG: hypothetical protein JWM57_3631 [Phycisphaerales bacterium]|nr:hypothetical protein [Phycisphaerales bacterium]
MRYQRLSIILLCCISSSLLHGAAPDHSASDTFRVRWQEQNKAIAVDGLSTTSQDTRLGMWWIDDKGLVRAALDYEAPSGKPTAVIRLPTTGRWAAFAGGKLQVFEYSSTSAAVELNVNGPRLAFNGAKPMSHGVVRQAGLPDSRWYVTDNHTLVWNGKPWIPYGGMFVSPVLFSYDTNQTPIAERWKKHAEALDQIQAAGFDELYLNLTHGPVEVRQQVVDDLNRRGIRFGWQLPTASASPLQGFLLRRRVSQGLIIGTCDKVGELKMRLPREHLLSMVLVSVEGTSVRRLNDAINLADPNKQPGFIQIDEVTKASDKTVATTLTVDGLPTGNYYVIPQAEIKSHASNLWGHEAEIVQRHGWIKSIKWGKGLRFFIDPVMNEEGLYNEAEPVRVWTDAFNNAYAKWLERRYTSIAALKTAWRLPDDSVESFADASRLIPLRDSEAPWAAQAMRWIDPVSLRQTTTLPGGVGQGWFDYLDGVRDTYADSRDMVTRGVKQIVEVPVVFKRVTPWVTREVINQTPGGFDGVGLELYPINGSPAGQGLGSGLAEAALASQTTWLIATEIGYSPATNNRGVRGFPDEKYVYNLVSTLSQFGVKGFMFFGWRLEPYDIWKPMQFHAMPDQLKWLRKARDLVGTSAVDDVPVAQVFPEGQCWWFKSGGESLNRYNAVLDDGPSAIRQSIELCPATADGSAPPLWAISSTPVIPNAAVRVVNLANADSAGRYGPQVTAWIRHGEKVIYLGTLPAGAKVDGLDQHFTAEHVKIGNDDAQVLHIDAGDQMLAEQNGKAWAKRTENLIIVARVTATIPAKADGAPALPEPQWVRDLLNSSLSEKK